MLMFFNNLIRNCLLENVGGLVLARTSLNFSSEAKNVLEVFLFLKQIKPQNRSSLSVLIKFVLTKTTVVHDVEAKSVLNIRKSNKCIKRNKSIKLQTCPLAFLSLMNTIV